MVPALFATLLLLVPLVAMVASTDWQALPGHLTSPVARSALRQSLLTSTVAIFFCLLLGLPLAWLLARVEFRGRGALRALVTGPLVLPPVGGVVARSTAFGRPGGTGEAGGCGAGFAFPFTTWGVVLAHVFVSMPFVIISIEGAFRSADARYDAAAATLGASRWTTFRRVTVPLAMPGVLAGTVLGWARSLGEFGATITFNGNYPGTTQTMPTLIYITRQADQDAALSLSLVMLLVSIGVLLALRDHWLGTP